MASNVWPSLFGVLSLIFIITGGLLIWFLPGVVDKKVEEELVIANNSDALDRFLDPPADIKLFVYLFNVTNSNEVKNHVKPELKQIGPYVYTEKIVKENVVFSNDGTRIKYDQKKIYQFDARHSGGIEEDIVYTLNFPMTLIAPFCRQEETCRENFYHPFVDSMFFSNDLMRKYEVKDVIFGTYPIMKDEAYEDTVRSLANVAFIKNDTTEDSSFEVYTGKNDISKLNVVYGFNGKRSLDFWNDESCDRLNGTDGSQFPPNVDKSKKLYTFSNDICRSLYFTYEKDSEIKGISGYHFVVPKDVFLSPDRDPNNMCFCTDRDETNDICPHGDGVLSLSSCQRGAPVFASAPHFLGAGDSYLDAVRGLRPENRYHQTTIDIRGDTGSVLNVHRRIQINVNVQPLPEYENLVNISIMFPVLWVDENAEINDETATYIQDKVLKPVLITKVGPPALIALGGVFLVICITLVIFVQTHR